MRKRRSSRIFQKISRKINLIGKRIGRKIKAKASPAWQRTKNTARQALDRSRFGRDVRHAHRHRDGRWTEVSSRGHHQPHERNAIHNNAARDQRDKEKKRQSIESKEKARTKKSSTDPHKRTREHLDRERERAEKARTERPIPTGEHRERPQVNINTRGRTDEEKAEQARRKAELARARAERARVRPRNEQGRFV